MRFLNTVSVWAHLSSEDIFPHNLGPKLHVNISPLRSWRHPRLAEAMVSASVSTGSWVTQKPDFWVAFFIAAGTDVVSSLSNWSSPPAWLSPRPWPSPWPWDIPLLHNLMPAGWHGFKITLTLSRHQIHLKTEMSYACHMSKNIHKNTFSLKSTEKKNWYSASPTKTMLLLKKIVIRARYLRFLLEHPNWN